MRRVEQSRTKTGENVEGCRFEPLVKQRIGLRVRWPHKRNADYGCSKGETENSPQVRGEDMPE